MTDRIKALGRQASKLALEEYYARQKTEFVGDVIYSDIYDQKLADLIIQECSIALKPMLRDMISRGHAVDSIKNHFGGEE